MSSRATAVLSHRGRASRDRIQDVLGMSVPYAIRTKATAREAVEAVDSGRLGPGERADAVHLTAEMISADVAARPYLSGFVDEHGHICPPLLDLPGEDISVRAVRERSGDISVRSRRRGSAGSETVTRPGLEPGDEEDRDP